MVETMDRTRKNSAHVTVTVSPTTVMPARTCTDKNISKPLQ
jgi:hypothetical protein